MWKLLFVGGGLSAGLYFVDHRLTGVGVVLSVLALFLAAVFGDSGMNR